MENYLDNDRQVKKEMRKAKRNIVLVFLLIFLLIFVVFPIVMYGVYSGLFPKAEKVDYPDYSLIESITVSKAGEQLYLSEEESSALYKYISTSKPTRIMSTNETPDAAPYFAVEIKSGDMSICGYVYEENEKFYFEIPYVGVYRFRI